MLGSSRRLLGGAAKCVDRDPRQSWPAQLSAERSLHLAGGGASRGRSGSRVACAQNRLVSTGERRAYRVWKVRGLPDDGAIQRDHTAVHSAIEQFEKIVVGGLLRTALASCGHWRASERTTN